MALRTRRPALSQCQKQQADSCQKEKYRAPDKTLSVRSEFFVIKNIPPALYQSGQRQYNTRNEGCVFHGRIKGRGRAVVRTRPGENYFATVVVVGV